MKERPGRARTAVRLTLGGALLSATFGLALSCVDAVGAVGYTDGFEATCELVGRCYEGGLNDCSDRLGRLEDTGGWLETLAEKGCLRGCRSVSTCIDFPFVCSEATCEIDEECCGASGGRSMCVDGDCCRTIGAACEDDYDCCPNAGQCDGATGTCGGVVCGAAGESCLNDFQCCAHKCEGGSCVETQCLEDGRVCAIDDDCCAGVCDPVSGTCGAGCTAPSGPCTTSTQCCDQEHFACKSDGSGGDTTVCLPKDCHPNNYDCSGNEQCCSGFCAPGYNLCGECHGAGEECSAAVPCCAGLLCQDGRCAALP